MVDPSPRRLAVLRSHIAAEAGWQNVAAP